MKIQIYDPPMCCSTGICGPDVDPALASFAGFLQQMRDHGATIERYNLAQQPLAFVQNPAVKSLLDDRGTDGLPLIFLNGEPTLSGRYPDSTERATWVKQLKS